METTERELFIICAFRKLREAWFNSHLRHAAHERVWESEDVEIIREQHNNILKEKYNIQTEQIINGQKASISPTSEFEMSECEREKKYK